VSYGACSSVYVAFIDALFPLRYPGRRHSVRSVAEIIEALTLYMVNIVRQYKVRMVTKSVMQFWTFSIGRSISLHRGSLFAHFELSCGNGQTLFRRIFSFYNLSRIWFDNFL
jgi:hypothetical protein